MPLLSETLPVLLEAKVSVLILVILPLTKYCPVPLFKLKLARPWAIGMLTITIPEPPLPCWLQHHPPPPPPPPVLATPLAALIQDQ